MTRKATDKQVSYALHLLQMAGYGSDYMSSAYKPLGATMRERQGRVEDWLANMDRSRISALIDQLLEEQASNGETEE